MNGTISSESSAQSCPSAPSGAPRSPASRRSRADGGWIAAVLAVVAVAGLSAYCGLARDTHAAEFGPKVDAEAQVCSNDDDSAACYGKSAEFLLFQIARGMQTGIQVNRDLQQAASAGTLPEAMVKVCPLISALSGEITAGTRQFNSAVAGYLALPTRASSAGGGVSGQVIDQLTSETLKLEALAINTVEFCRPVSTEAPSPLKAIETIESANVGQLLEVFNQIQGSAEKIYDLIRPSSAAAPALPAPTPTLAPSASVESSPNALATPAL